MDILNRVCAAMYGEICWGAEYSPYTGIRMHFGRPHLCIREQTKQIPRRLAVAEGEWCWRTGDSAWTVVCGGKIAMSSSSLKAIRCGVFRLNGQKLMSVEVSPTDYSTTLTFDLGGRLTYRRRRHVSSTFPMWMLFRPNGYVFALYRDGTFDHTRGRAGVRHRPLRLCL